MRYSLTLALLVLPVSFAWSCENLFNSTTNFPHASSATIDLVNKYFQYKDGRNIKSWETPFAYDINYCDSTLGMCWNYTTFAETIGPIVNAWGPNATSYPLEVAGTEESLVVYSSNTPEEFGYEIRLLSAVNMQNGKVVRNVDYWDGRANPVAGELAGPLAEYPLDLEASSVASNVSTQLNDTVQTLSGAFSSCDASSVGAMFDFNGVFEDLTLRARIEGASAITRYFNRTLSMLPYGPGSAVRHVLGGDMGGGYEWYTINPNLNSTIGVLNGVVQLEFNNKGSITLFRTVWNGARMANETIKELAVLALEN